jgi:iron complex outermembrane receptor protein
MPKRALRLAICAAIGLTAPGISLQADETVLEEVVVTGTKRDTSMQDTPLAVSTLTEGMIANTFVNDVRAVADLSPNVLLTKQPGFNAIAGGIRGTGSTSILVTQDTSVSITVDDFGISSVQSQFVELFDVQQIEVYRGPQGTLFGKNSTGGVIAITTKQPDLQEYGGSVEFTYGQYDANSADAVKITASMDLPIIEDVLGIRFAGVHDSHDGWITNSKDTATFPEFIPLYAAFGLPAVNPPLPPELDTTTVGDGGELNEKEVLAFKTKVLWKPTDNYEALLTWEYSRDDSGAPPAVNETPKGENFLWDALGFPGTPTTGFDDVYQTGQSNQGNGINVHEGHQVDVDGFYLSQTLELDNYTIKALLGHRETDETLASTYTGEAFNNLFDASRNLERTQEQFELRVVSNFDGDFNFVAGAVFSSDDVDFRAIATQGLVSVLPAFNLNTMSFYDERGYINLDLDPINDPGTTVTNQERDSFAYYIDGNWAMTDKITISAGVRYTKDEKEFFRNANGGGVCSQYTKAKDAVLADPNAPFDWQTNCAADNRSSAISRAGITGNQYDPRKNPLPPEHYGVNITVKDEWDDTTWRFVVDYKFSDDQMIYGSVATGFISGGFTETCSTLTTCVAYAPEENTNFEFGHKGDFLNNTLRINTAIFYTEYENLQRNQVVPYQDAAGNPAQETLTVNAGESTHYGLEVEATWLASDNLTVRAGLGLLEAEYDDFAWDPQPNNPATGVTDFSSLDVPFSAPVQFSIDATYDMEMSNGGMLEWNLNANYQDEAEGSPFDTNAAVLIPAVIRHPTNSQIEERTIVNASVTYRPPSDNFYITAFGQNLTDENTRIGANSVANLWVMSFFSPPRLMGVRFGTKF